jgi:hypothetical protein
MKGLLISLLLGAASAGYVQAACENIPANSPFTLQEKSVASGAGSKVTITASALSCDLQAIKFTVTWTQTFNTKPYLPAGCTWNVAGTALTCELVEEIGIESNGSSVMTFTTADVVSNVEITAAGIVTLEEVWAEN